MIKKLSFFLFSLVSTLSISQELIQDNSSISFFSNAPIEDIFSESKHGISTLSGHKKLFTFEIKIESFSFKNPLMKDHFNDSYMESSKFPKASFNGKIRGNFSLLKDGVYKVFVIGNLIVHGVTKLREIPGKIIVKNGKVNIVAKFAIKLEEHGVKIPSLMTKKIAEIVEVNVSINYKK
jgi:polyisoprenoid-binding protein YceI